MDVLTKKQRSYCMSQIKGRNTRLEQSFRKYIWNKGLTGYRTKSRITGKPDLYFPTKKIAVFIDGCFWHKCPKCFIEPKSNKKFWKDKIKKNVQRDIKVNKLLKEQHIRTLRFWEHEIKKSLPKCFNRLKKLYHKYQ